ncbi:MAG TPA: ACT domain-containing protein [Thermoanaerobaculia bacterium]|nr:ACT domain-containing protein [Thermoanaerobaculia bacterium]
MVETVKRVEYYYVAVPDEPGSAARVLMSLKEGGVNLLACLAFPTGNKQAQIDLVAENPATLKQAAGKAGLKLSDAKRAFLIQGDDRPGAVAGVARKLADAKINITAAAAAGSGAGRYGMILWVAPVAYDRAAQALGA